MVTKEFMSKYWPFAYLQLHHHVVEPIITPTTDEAADVVLSCVQTSDEFVHATFRTVKYASTKMLQNLRRQSEPPPVSWSQVTNPNQLLGNNYTHGFSGMWTGVCLPWSLFRTATSIFKTCLGCWADSTLSATLHWFSWSRTS